MRLRCATLFIPTLLLLVIGAVHGQESPEPKKFLEVELERLGDATDGVATRLTFHYQSVSDGQRGLPYVLGSVLQDGKLVHSFRVVLRESELEELSTTTVLPLGEVTIEARLMLETEQGLPHLIAKVTEEVTVAPTGTPFVADDDTDAEAILVEGFVPETSGAVRLSPPRRDVAPNLFIVEATVKAPAVRLEFWVDGKKIQTRNAPPYRAELDLGTLPRGVEIKVVGYDRRGRFVDADAWVVNEREAPLDARITRTEGQDGRSHVKVSVQGSRRVARVELWADERKIAEWKAEPFAVALDQSVLVGVEYLRASAFADDGLEATDILYLSGDRYFERVDVNLIEFPVTVLDQQGRPVTGLEKEDFVVREDGKPVELSQFGFSENLPLSVGVLVDQSGSMSARLEDAKKAAIGFLESVMRTGDRGFIGGFSWSTKTLTPLVSDPVTLRMQVDQMSEASGATALYDSIVAGLYRFRNVEGRKALVVVTDGEDTASRVSHDDMITYVRASRVPLYFIGINLSPLDFRASAKLRSLAEETGGIAFFIDGVGELEATYDAIETELRTQYLLGYYTESSGAKEQYRTVDVEIPGRQVTIRAIRGYIP